MFMRFFSFLLLVFFSIQITAENPLVFSPDFSGSTSIISAGTNLVPLCTHPNDPTCISQWSQQAVPLAMHSGEAGNFPQFQYFFPVFIPSRMASKDLEEDDKDWEVFTPSFSYSSRFRSRRWSGKSKRQKLESKDSEKTKKDQPAPEKVKKEASEKKQSVPGTGKTMDAKDKIFKKMDEMEAEDKKNPWSYG